VTTVLQIVHGYPPRELAGTELATARLVRGLQRRGWRCHVLASTRAPGLEQYRVLDGEPGITRIVNNMPYRPLGDAERDPIIEDIARRICERIDPDIVHVQHLAFLSSGLRLPVPTVGTLHDHWPWCPAGGTMLRPDGAPCPAPDAPLCARCYAAHARLPGGVERAAVSIAEKLSGVVDPALLHRCWRRLPASLRGRARGQAPSPGTADEVLARREALCEAWRSMDRRMAPSGYLARQAELHGLGEVEVVPAGVAPGAPHRGGGPLLYLGSILPHKGVHLVVEAYRAVHGGPDSSPGLLIHGDPAGDPAYADGLRWPIAGRIEPAAVPGVMNRARALVMGSTWPENAPLVLLEARAAGCPVVAPRIGGIPELVEDGLDGFLYAAGDASSLAAALERIADPAQAGALAPRPAPSPAAHLDQVEAIYRQVISDHGVPRAGPRRREP
jgi:glycosyltransferase involved in cell wall biosynthesis